LARNNSGDVIVKHKNHQQDQYEKTGLLGHFAHFDTYRSADEQFDEKEQQMPSVQDRYGQYIQNGQIDADQGNEKDQVGSSLFGLLPC
jgi:hypothetical protein